MRMPGEKRDRLGIRLLILAVAGEVTRVRRRIGQKVTDEG